jgi:hypothetical protein
VFAYEVLKLHAELVHELPHGLLGIGVSENQEVMVGLQELDDLLDVCG